MPLSEWWTHLVEEHPDVAWMLLHAKNWQPLFGSLIGFAGIVFTLLVNAWLSRRLEVIRRKREAKTIEVALREELQGLHMVILKRIATIEKIALGEQSSGISPPPGLDIYTANLTNIGRLNERRVRSIIEVSNLRTELLSTLKSFDNSGQTHKAKETNSISIPDESVRDIAAQLLSVEMSCRKAIARFGGKPLTNLTSERIGYNVGEGSGAVPLFLIGAMIGTAAGFGLDQWFDSPRMDHFVAVIIALVFFITVYGWREIDINQKIRQHDSIRNLLGLQPRDQTMPAFPKLLRATITGLLRMSDHQFDNMWNHFVAALKSSLVCGVKIFISALASIVRWVSARSVRPGPSQEN